MGVPLERRDLRRAGRDLGIGFAQSGRETYVTPSGVETVVSEPSALFFIMGYVGSLWMLVIVLPRSPWRGDACTDANLAGPFFFLGLVPFFGGIALLVFTLLDSKPAGARFGPNPPGGGRERSKTQSSAAARQQPPEQPQQPYGQQQPYGPALPPAAAAVRPAVPAVQQQAPIPTDASGAPPLWAPWYGAGFLDAFVRFWKKYAGSTARASRSEFWWWYLANAIVVTVLFSAYIASILVWAAGATTTDEYGTTTSTGGFPAVALLFAGLLGCGDSRRSSRPSRSAGAACTTPVSPAPSGWSPSRLGSPASSSGAWSRAPPGRSTTDRRHPARRSEHRTRRSGPPRQGWAASSGQGDGRRLRPPGDGPANRPRRGRAP